MVSFLFKKKILIVFHIWYSFVITTFQDVYLAYISPLKTVSCIHSSTIKMGPEMFYETLISPLLADWRHLPKIDFSPRGLNGITEP